ncbi:MAG TPA: helix-turn-helix transcriptional regulator [Thermoanaerobaculia bacterium]|nr:helix-turn-helix transcriptional regulator [Thermoanaerobaculia bacterium]
MDRPPFDTLLYRSPIVTIASFRAEPSHPGFRDSGPAENHCFVFPRTSVRIVHVDRRSVVTDPNVVTFYNRDQVYFRERMTQDGDRCDWFAVEPGVLLEAMRRHDPAAADRPDAPFRFTHGPGDAESYLLQRLVVRHLAEGGPVDPLFVEESALRLLAQVVSHAARAWDLSMKTPEPRQEDLAEAAKTVLAGELGEPLTLDEVARRAGSSVFHLCRTFRRHTGSTLHGYRTQMRLRTALERAADPGTDLTDLALDLGYSSHSHFTAAFRKVFGMAPSAFRKKATVQAVRELIGSQ